MPSDYLFIKKKKKKIIKTGTRPVYLPEMKTFREVFDAWR